MRGAPVWGSIGGFLGYLNGGVTLNWTTSVAILPLCRKGVL